MTRVQLVNPAHVRRLATLVRTDYMTDKRDTDRIAVMLDEYARLLTDIREALITDDRLEYEVLR